MAPSQVRVCVRRPEKNESSPQASPARVAPGAAAGSGRPRAQHAESFGARCEQGGRTGRNGEEGAAGNRWHRVPGSPGPVAWCKGLGGISCDSGLGHGDRTKRFQCRETRTGWEMLGARGAPQGSAPLRGPACRWVQPGQQHPKQQHPKQQHPGAVPAAAGPHSASAASLRLHPRRAF